MIGASEMSGGAVGQMRSTLFGAGIQASIAATAFSALIVLTRLSGQALFYTLLVCAILLGLLESARRVDPAWLSARCGSPAVVIIGCAVLGFVFVGVAGLFVFLPALILLATLATVASLPSILLGSMLVVAPLVTPWKLPFDAPASWATLPAAFLLILLPLAVACLAGRSGEEIGHGVPPTEAGQSSSPDDIAGLTPRQSQVVTMVSDGWRHAEIADQIGVSTPQVRRLLRQARERTGCSNNRELVAWAADREAPRNGSVRVASTQK